MGRLSHYYILHLFPRFSFHRQIYDGISCTAEHSFREIVPNKNLDEQFSFCYRKVSGRMNEKPHASHILISSVLTSLHLFGVLRHIIRPYGLQKLDVII